MFKLLLIFFGIFICIKSYSQNNPKDTVVTGKTGNAKWGAVVITSKGNTFYIDGKDSWPDKQLNKQVEVSGTLKIQKFSEKDIKDENGDYQQGMIGEKKTIHKAKIKMK